MSTGDGARHRFDDEVVIVTGAARGIGQAVALRFAAAGAHVVIVDLDAWVVDETVALIEAEGGSVLGIAADVRDAKTIVCRVLDRFGRIDVLVNNAGVAHSGPFGPESAADAERLLGIHALGSVAMTAAAWDALQSSAGRVVNVTSGTVFGLPLATAYATAKGAVLGFTRALAREPGSAVRVNAVMPMARTRMFEASGGVAGSSEDELVSRYFPAEAVAPVVVHLARTDTAADGQVYEVAGAAVSRITFASGPTVVMGSGDDIDARWEELGREGLTEVDALETSMAAKLTLLMTAEGGTEG